MKQSTNHVMMIEPLEFYANPETAETNSYQAGAGVPDPEILRAALSEFWQYHKILSDAGVKITLGEGIAGCPDMVFPNWFYTHPSGEMILCPMLNPNRQAERTPELIDLLRSTYPTVLDWTGFEKEGRALESTASIVADHVHKCAYAALSSRTDEALVRQWATHRGYDVEIFETQSHTGIPVYHTDCVMWIGSTLAGVCDSVIRGQSRQRVVQRLEKTHDVIRFTGDQLRTFCGNALEVLGGDAKRFLAISEGAVQSLSPEQRMLIERHYEGLLTSPLYTLEKYGGGSARCMLAELF